MYIYKLYLYNTYVYVPIWVNGYTGMRKGMREKRTGWKNKNI